MRPYSGDRHGEAEYNRFTTIPSGTVPSGATRPDGGDHFAEMVHVVNDIGVSIEGSDIQIGAVELKDANTDNRANIVSGSTNALAVHITNKNTGVETDANLAQDENGNILQVSRYNTSNAINLYNSNISFGSDTAVRMIATDADAWISFGTDAGATAGMFLPMGAEITVLVLANEDIYAHGATVNIVPLD